MHIHNDFILCVEMIQNSSCYAQVGLIKRGFDARAQVPVSALLSGNYLTVEIRAEQKVWGSINTDRYSVGRVGGMAESSLFLLFSIWCNVLHLSKIP